MQGLKVNRRLLLSVALIAVLLSLSLLLTRPICREGFVASLDTRSGWSCVADNP